MKTSKTTGVCYIDDPRLLEQEQVEELLELYQDWLRLRDWIITVDVDVPLTTGETNYGLVTTDYKNRRARIKLFDPDGLPPKADPFDSECVLVHELCHVSHAGVDETIREDEDKNLLLDAAVEQHMESLTNALVTLRRDAWRMSWE